MLLITKQLQWLNTYQGLIVPMAIEAFAVFLLMAVAAISLIPVTLLFFLFQRAFIQGIALTGLKE